MLMSEESAQGEIGRRLLQLGVVLFLLGLLTGLAVPAMENPRMGLASHLEAVMNGIFVLVVGAIWHRLRLGMRAQRIAFWLLAYGTFANWITTLLAAVWGAGEPMMPLAARGHTGTSAQEALIAFGLISLSVAMIIVAPLLLWGLRSRGTLSSPPTD
jgi:hydroxylaminobenzene mutase